MISNESENAACAAALKRKPRKRTVYVLTGSYSYESTHVLGVYTTRKRAEKARSTGSHGSATDYDFYSIDGCTLK